MRRRQFLIGLAALSCGTSLWFASRNRLIIANRTGQLIRGLIVEMCESTIQFGDLPADSSQSARFGTPNQEDCFVVRGQLEDGTRIDAVCGYVVWEDYAAVFHLAIHPDGEVECG
jgi:hypothetical protein